MVNLHNFFSPKRVAVIGVSRAPTKVGHVVFKNLVEGGFEGEVYAVNPKTSQILHHTVYPSIISIRKPIDLAVIAVPAEVILVVLRECARAKIKNLVILTAGFSEVGNGRLEGQVKELLTKHKMRAVGVNCLGIYDAYSKLDTLFIPRYRLRRPRAGSIGFVCQSGAVGAAILDIATSKGHAFSRFISYGNATDLDESDLIEYLGEDKHTAVICVYLEGVKNGEKFFNTIEKVSKKKPIVAIKGGVTDAGSKAAMSHTGTLAGSAAVFKGIFKQTGVIQAESLEELFDVASLVERGIMPKGGRVQVITNGGGYGIMCTDLVSSMQSLSMAQLSLETQETLRKAFPPRVNVHNPLDLVGDADSERYRIALEACTSDTTNDVILLNVLFQLPMVTTELVDIISEMKRASGKPIIVVSTGGEFTDRLSEGLEELGVPVFSYPKNAVIALDKVTWWMRRKQYT